MFGELFRAMQVSFNRTCITGTCLEFLSFLCHCKGHTHKQLLSSEFLSCSGILQFSLHVTHNQYLFRIFELCISLQMSFHGTHTHTQLLSVQNS